MLSNPLTQPKFFWVLSYQELPNRFNADSGFYVVNTDPVYKKGSHWLVINKISNNNLEFFDSLGRDPSYYAPEILNFIENSVSNYTFSVTPIQGDSHLCGNYCLIYGYLSCDGFSLDQFLNLFTNDLLLNDKSINKGWFKE